MESRVQIITDSSCDLPPEVLAEYDIEVVPLVVNFGTEEFDDSKLTPDQYWTKAAEGQTGATDHLVSTLSCHTLLLFTGADHPRRGRGHHHR